MTNSPGRYGAFFKTKVVVLNPTEFDCSIQVTLYSSYGNREGNRYVNNKMLEIKARQYLTWENFLNDFFDNLRGSGAVMFESQGPGYQCDFSVYAEVYTESPNGRFSTLVVDGVGADALNLGRGVSRFNHLTDPADPGAVLIVNAGLTSSDEQRINIGLFNQSDLQLEYVAYVFDGEGNIIEEISLVVPGRGWIQKAVLSKFENGYITWGQTGNIYPPSHAYPWVVTVNNKSNDGVLVPPVIFRP